MRKKRNLKKLLNLGFVDCTNRTMKIGNLDMPYVNCGVLPEIDYLATYSQPSTYFKTPTTCLSFFEYDICFDGFYGLWNAIYYDVVSLKEFYKERFQGVRYYIAPDYSKCGDIPEIENIHRQFRSRVVSVWLTMNLNAVVIPLVSCANRNSMPYMLDGMVDCETVAFNAKGAIGNPSQLSIFKESIRYAVDNLPKLKCIIVYSASPNKQKVFEIFEYAAKAGVTVRIPDNMLMSRNRLRGDDNGIG